MKTFQFLSFLLLVLSSIAFWPVLFLMKSFCPLRILQILSLTFFFLAVMKKYTYMFLSVLILHGSNKLLVFALNDFQTFFPTHIQCLNWIVGSHPICFFIFSTSEHKLRGERKVSQYHP